MVMSVCSSDLCSSDLVQLRLVEPVDFSPGTVIDYRVTSRPDGGCHVAVDFQRIAVSARGRLIGLLVQLMGRHRFAADLGETLDRQIGRASCRERGCRAV